MSSTIFFFLFIPLLALILLAINLIFAPHNPYQEKNSVFECGFSSFLGQNRTQFSISFFIFALLFLLFDLEILLVYPYLVSAYTNAVYGLALMLIFLLALTLGFAFELGKKALSIDSRQMSDIQKGKASYISNMHTRVHNSLGWGSFFSCLRSRARKNRKRNNNKMTASQEKSGFNLKLILENFTLSKVVVSLFVVLPITALIKYFYFGGFSMPHDYQDLYKIGFIAWLSSNVSSPIITYYLNSKEINFNLAQLLWGLQEKDKMSFNLYKGGGDPVVADSTSASSSGPGPRSGSGPGPEPRSGSGPGPRSESESPDISDSEDIKQWRSNEAHRRWMQEEMSRLGNLTYSQLADELIRAILSRKMRKGYEVTTYKFMDLDLLTDEFRTYQIRKRYIDFILEQKRSRHPDLKKARIFAGMIQGKDLNNDLLHLPWNSAPITNKIIDAIRNTKG